MKPLQVLYLISLVLVLVGAINWALVGYNPKWNVADNTVGEENSKYVYYVIGAAAVAVAFFNFKHFKKLF